MKCQGEFIFKSIDKVDKGSFTGSDGRTIEYQGSYKLNVDEWVDSKLNSIKFKIAEENKTLVERLKALEPYQKILLDCDVKFYNSQVKVIPIDFKIVNSGNK